MLTISQLAGFVGVTVRAVRHYHARGLLSEPGRDASGYRRYDGHTVVDLIRIKTLADAGVPLSRVSELLHCEPERFTCAVDQIDKELRERIQALQDHRKRVRRLAAGDSLALPDDVVDYLARLRALGISERTIGMERDGWILLAAHSPDWVATWIDEKRDGLDDKEYLELYRAVDQAFDWQPDDPRLPDLADAYRAYVAGLDPEDHRALSKPSDVDLDETLMSLLVSQSSGVSPAWERLSALLEEDNTSESQPMQASG